MLYLALPVMDGHDLTRECLGRIKQTVVDRQAIEIVVFDNASIEPYDEQEVGVPLVRWQTNWSYYHSLQLLRDMVSPTPADLLALIHNDVFIYEEGWDRRLRMAFVNDGQLAAVGLCGSNELDDRGGRGGGTMCNFDGRRGQLQEHTGRRISDLQPACLFDSMFMCFREAAIPDLGVIDEHIPLGHFTDKLWPMRLVEKGWHVGILGLLCDHMGGMTSVGAGRWETECAAWCEREGIPVESGKGGITVYLEAERRFLNEMRQKGLIPSKLNGWNLVRG